MSEHEARLERDVYDHQDELSPSGRRRGPVADWGVGEELFEQMPRRRFQRGEEPGRPARDRRPAAPPERGDVPRGGVEDGRRTLQIGSDEDVPSEIAAVTADRDLEAGGPGTPETAAVEPPAAREDLALADPPAAPPALAAPSSAPSDAPVRSAQGERGRRTIKIEGRPGGARRDPGFHQGPQRLRPGRSVGERMGARPDRLAAWAFALGLLLILIAVLSSLL